MAEGFITDSGKALKILKMLTGEAMPVIPRLCPEHNEPVQWNVVGSGSNRGGHSLQAIFTGCCQPAVDKEIELVEELLKADDPEPLLNESSEIIH